MQEMISLEAALEKVLDLVTPLSMEAVSLFDAQDRILAENVYAEANIPPFNRSPLDGYAVKGEDTIGASKDKPVHLEVIEEVAAGYIAARKLRPRSAIKIMTGAPIPDGADAVIRFEDVIVSKNQISISTALKPLENVSLAGEDLSVGDLILAENTTLNPYSIGLLAAVGKAYVSVYQKPRIAILSTGDELIDVNEPLKPGKIRNSNLYMLSALVKEAGGEPIILGIVPDTLEETTTAFRKALRHADLVISTGGVSVGDYDVVKKAIVTCGTEMLFWKVAAKPGTPVAVGYDGGKLVFGLSGNPAGASIIFEVLVKPVIKKLAGKKQVLPFKVAATLEDTFLKKSGMRRFLRGKTYQTESGLKVVLTGKQRPGVLSSLQECNALIDVPAGSSELLPGKQVEVFLIREHM